MKCLIRFLPGLPLFLFLAAETQAAELRVPAATAYVLPDAQGARVDSRGVTGWTNPAMSLNWYGRFSKAGVVSARVELRLPAGTESKLRLTVGQQSHPAVVVGKGGDSLVTADFGEYTLPQQGYARFALESLGAQKQPLGDLDALVLDGPALEGAHFNLNPRRNAASVHLMYPVPADVKIAAFYCEVTAVEAPTATFVMACGWHRGYFGMQVNSPSERRIIFSVWDSGDEEVDRDKVADENRVRLVGKGEGVYAGDFGNEGTGGHSHLVYHWKTGETQRFVVTAEPVDSTSTIFAGYWFHPEKRAWMPISAWKAPKEGGWLKRPHSFSEDFWDANGNLVRKARYGNQWIRTPEGAWQELTTASFSHDPTGKADRLDRFMGVEDGQFFLSHGGFIEGFTPFGQRFDRPATGKAPTDIQLPPLEP